MFQGLRVRSSQSWTVLNLDIFNLTFRLGPFGFLTTETEEAPGNLGLRDQSLALEWIKNEASNFCGDPNRISIFGSGSGATSAILQMISPFNQGKNLFNGVIAQSGSPVMNSIFEIGNRKKAALALASDVGCKNTEVSIYSENNLFYTELSLGFQIWGC